MKLISMTDFVAKLYDKAKLDDITTCFLRCVDYMKFLKQPLTIGMFVPCDLDGNVLQYPDHLDYKAKNSSSELVWKSDFACNNYHKLYDEYQEAKERILFEGFSNGRLEQGRNTIDIFFLCDVKIDDIPETFWFDKKETVEDLLGFDFEFTLTKTAKTQIGL